MQVKAQGLLNAVKWIEESYGQGALRDVIRACGPEVRERYTSAIAIEWHPVAEFVEFLAAADRLLGHGDGRVAEDIGAAGARVNLRGTALRMVFYAARPEFLMKRITQLWSRFNDEGSMNLLHFDDYSSTIEVRGVVTPHVLFCSTLTGWAREVVLAMGGTTPSVRHVECRARGDARCLWHLRWSGTAVIEASEKKRSDGAASVAPPPMPPSTSRISVVEPTRSSGRIFTAEPHRSSRRMSIEPKPDEKPSEKPADKPADKPTEKLSERPPPSQKKP